MNTLPVVVARAALSPEEMSEAQALATLCNQSEGLDLKLTYPSGQSAAPDAFLCYADGRLVGYCGLDGEEVCGMVHPAHRRQGIGARLLAAAQEWASQRSKSPLLLICETASESGQAFIAAQGASFAFGEHRMILEGQRMAPGRDTGLRLQQAGPPDLDRLAEIIAASFGDPQEIAHDAILRSLAQSNERFYLALLDDTPVGAFKVVSFWPGAGIYAFGVLPSHQGQGLGRQILLQACKLVLNEGYHFISLEVETDNARAIHLYQACGFQASTTYGYYHVSIPHHT
jgi:ribosomal protein S18 acetylase RimI-like enzyme